MFPTYIKNGRNQFFKGLFTGTNPYCPQTFPVEKTTLDATIFSWDITKNGIIGAQHLANALSGTSYEILNLGETTIAELGNLGKFTAEDLGALGGVGAIAFSAVDMYQKGVNWSNGTDMVMGFVAFIPVVGWAISGTYFIANIIVTGTTGESIGQHLGNAVSGPDAQQALMGAPLMPGY